MAVIHGYNAAQLNGGKDVPASDSQPTIIRFGVFDLDPQAGELRKTGHRIPLRPQAARLLALLARRPGQVLTREELKDEIWGKETFVDFEHGLNLCIRQIREALGDDAANPRYVETLPRHGYRFIAPVHDTQSATDSAVDLQRIAHNTTPITSAPSRSYRPVAIFGAIAAAVLIAVVATNPGEWRARLLGSTVRPVRAIAVLPLQNLSGDPAQDYFADGMTEAITTDLARMESLQVISRTSTMQYKTAQKSLPVIAHELNADAIVEGSVQRSGNRVRVTAQLVRAADDRHLWAETYERDFRDILALQDDVASAIAKQVESRLGGPPPQPLAKAQTISPEAYETYLKANYYLDQFDLQKSIDYYNQAIKLDPNYAPAYAHMADAYFFLGFFGAMPPRQAWGKVKEAGLLAVAKDERLPEGHGALALAKLHYDWDFAGAEQEFRRALDLNPNNADIRHSYAHYLMAMGRMDESDAESRRAVELDPVDDGLTDCLCWHRYAARKYESSIQLALEVLKRQPNDTWELAILGWDYEQSGLPDRAVTQFKKAVEVEPKDSPISTFLFAGLAQAYALAGMKSEAEQALRTLLEKSKRSYVSAFDIALIYTALGEKDTAFDWLKKAVDERSTFLVYSKWEPRLDPLRADPRFGQMLKKIGFPT
jgi:TolB-like protein/DNA-binding winged helix-turn-helix (wHTH) protein/Tfp pilus assembly protein PilF